MKIAEKYHTEIKERNFAQTCDVTGNRWVILKDFYKLPEIMKGAKVLDICAGESDFTAVLNSMGADAYALDYGYSNLEVLHERRVATGRRNLSHKNLSEVFFSLPNLEIQQSTQRFRESFRKNPDKYIHASAMNIPFPDNYFDNVFSFFGIIGVFEDDIKLLRKSIDEAIRVTKSKGIIQLGPAASGTQTYLGRINTSRIVTELMTRKDEVRVGTDFFDFHGDSVQRITITKS